MTHHRPDGSPAKKTDTGSRLTAERQAFAAALRAEFTGRGFGVRAFAREVKDADASTVSRYLSGARVAPQWFLDSLAEQAHRGGQPIARARLEELRRLREVALRGSGHANYRLQARVEELQALVGELQGQVQAVTVRWCLVQEEAEVQHYLRAGVLEEHRAVLARLQQLQEDLAAAHEHLLLAGTERGRLEEENAVMRRQLHAASAYVQDLEARLQDSERQRAEMAQTIRREDQHAAAPSPRQSVPPAREEAAQPPGAAPARPAGDGPATPERKDTALRNNLRWLAAFTSLTGSLALFFAGMFHVEEDSHLTLIDAVLPAGGLLSLLLIATPLAARAVAADPRSTEESSDGDEYMYGYYPMV
ncbi:hypothetical protein SUDANB176_07841 (plasmid) [Streptomyces sp. enrichment culture]|uniref:hypothetical protein n=1 Tax=Streptomyces sp. enrichment culture TaxID=1795815 RepID=UPI003F56F881